MPLFKLLSVLLCYPEQALIESVDVIRQQLHSAEITSPALFRLLDQLAQEDLITLQENYVHTFDRTQSQSLHLFEHLHGEDRARGQAMVDLLAEYEAHGFAIATKELPDYLPLFLEFLSVCAANDAQDLLGEAIDVISHIGHRLSASNSAYAGVFEVLRQLSPRQPKPLTVPPVRDMDSALQRFGPNDEGIEPLLATVTSPAPASCRGGACQQHCASEKRSVT